MGVSTAEAKVAPDQRAQMAKIKDVHCEVSLNIAHAVALKATSMLA